MTDNIRNMDPLSITANVIAILQLTSTIISSCTAYISAVKDAPKDLRAIMIEVGSLQAIIRVIDLPTPDQAHSRLLESLRGPSGPLDRCKEALKALSKLLDEHNTEQGTDDTRPTKRAKTLPSITTLAWPLKRNKAKDLLEEIGKYKSTISLALTADSR
jgi:Fungal N-terminal domain of STAND proteins